MELDNLDKKLVTIIQSGFPVTPEPFRDLAQSLGTSEEDVLVRIKRLMENKIIRRLGGVFDSRKLGYTSTLCALNVPPGRIDHVAGVVNGYPGVTHNYLRDHHYNMWFTLMALDGEEIENILGEIKNRTGINNLISLPAVKVYKIRVNFNLTEGCHAGKAGKGDSTGIAGGFTPGKPAFPGNCREA